MECRFRSLGWAASIIGAAMGTRMAGLGEAESFAVLMGLLAAFWGAEGHGLRRRGC